MKLPCLLLTLLGTYPQQVTSCAATGGNGNPIPETPCTNEQVAVRLDVGNAKAFDEKTVTGNTMRLVCAPLADGGTSSIELFSNAGDPEDMGTSPALEDDNSLSLICINGVWMFGAVAVVEASCQASPVETVQCTDDQVGVRLNVDNGKEFDEKTVDGGTMRLVCNPLGTDGTSDIEVFSNVDDLNGATPTLAADNSVTLTCVNGVWMINGVTVVEASCQASPEETACTVDDLAIRLTGLEGAQPFDDISVSDDGTTLDLLCLDNGGGLSEIQLFPELEAANGLTPMTDPFMATLTCVEGVWQYMDVTIVEAVCQAFG